MTAKILSMTTSKSGIRPVEFKVVVKPDETKSKTDGGVFLPDTVVEKEDLASETGIIDGVAEYAFTGWGESAPKVGDRVVFPRHSGRIVTGIDGQKYRVMQDKVVCAILE